MVNANSEVAVDLSEVPAAILDNIENLLAAVQLSLAILLFP